MVTGLACLLRVLPQFGLYCLLASAILVSFSMVIASFTASSIRVEIPLQLMLRTMLVTLFMSAIPTTTTEIARVVLGRLGFTEGEWGEFPAWSLVDEHLAASYLLP